MRTWPLCLFLLVNSAGLAQAVERKHLVMSFAGGGGQLNLFSDRKDIAASGLVCGAFRAAFGYAISDKWSLGIHYDRIGTAELQEGVTGSDRLHVTTYLLAATFRPWNKGRSALQCEMAVGPTAAALFPIDSRLPYTNQGTALALSVNYLHMLNRTLGWFVAGDQVTSSSNELVVDGGQVNPDGRISRLQWNSQRFTAGLVVRF